MAKNEKAGDTPELVVVDREDKYFTHTVNYDMSQTAANAHMTAAHERYGVPARQETIRTAIIAASLILGPLALHACHVSDEIIKALIITIGGGWGVTSVIGKWKETKALPPPDEKR